jgi:uncharacterized protein (DUF983 family)
MNKTQYGPDHFRQFRPFGALVTVRFTSTTAAPRPAKRGIKAECPQCGIVFRNASARNDDCPRCDVPMVAV